MPSWRMVTIKIIIDIEIANTLTLFLGFFVGLSNHDILNVFLPHKSKELEIVNSDLSFTILIHPV